MFNRLENHLLDFVPTPWMPSLTLSAVSVILVRNQDISRVLHCSFGRSLGAFRMVKVRGPKSIETEYHFLPWSFEPCRGAHLSHRLPLSPSTAQGRSRMIDRDGDEERDACHRSQQDTPKQALSLSAWACESERRGLWKLVSTPSWRRRCHTRTHPSPLCEPLL